MENITRTVYGSRTQTNLLLALQQTLVPFTTLNEKLGIQAGVAPAVNDITKMYFMSIGNGGHRNTVGANNIPKTEPVQHLATDAAPYNIIPFVLREPSNDLSPAQRQNYGLRRIEEHNGLNWVAYYLKVLDMTGVKTMMYEVSVMGDVVDTQEFVPTSAVLNPVPQDLSPTGVNILTGQYVAANAVVPFRLTPFDVTELLNVANIKYGDEGLAIISELELVTGTQKVVEITGGGMQPFNFLEVINAQVISHVNVYYPLRYSLNGFELLIDVGATEPLFKLAPGSGATTQALPINIPFPTGA